LQWETYPICFLPKSLRGAEITDLDLKGLDTCLEFITDEENNAASTSHNFLDKGGLNTLAILGCIIFVLITIIILAMAVCFSRHRARYYTQEEKHIGGEAGKCLEKNVESTATETPTAESAIKNKELNFKFPINDRVCTIDEIILPPPPPPPTKLPPTKLPPTSTSTKPSELKETQQQMKSLQSGSIVVKTNLIQLSPTTTITTTTIPGSNISSGNNKNILTPIHQTIPLTTTSMLTLKSSTTTPPTTKTKSINMHNIEQTSVIGATATTTTNDINNCNLDEDINKKKD
ncbi:poly(A) polymerase-like, partial [Condylostylus longicornis]|uniref:poly(A) polymerase-like n=1 Tax=Condylostylus longicornis TaxID=2530218 RepID=UPI00244E5AD8